MVEVFLLDKEALMVIERDRKGKIKEMDCRAVNDKTGEHKANLLCNN